MKIIFVCKHNRFRSKVAEAFFRNLVRDIKDAECESYGILLDRKRNYVGESVKKIMKEKGLEVDDKPQQLFLQDLDSIDKIICLTKDVNNDFFCDRTEVETWDIEDTSADDVDKIRRIVGEIEDKVKDLAGRINV